MSAPVALAIAVALLVGNAFFVGAEFAVTSSRRAALEPLAEAGDARARTALWALEHVSAMLATAQLGVTLCSTGLGVIAEPALAHLLAGPLLAVGVGESGAHAAAVVAALVIVVFLHVVAGEMVPKNLSIAAPESAVRWLAPPLVALSRLVGPVIAGLNGIANGVLRALGMEPRDEVSAVYTVEEVAAIVERSTAEGVLDDDSGLLSSTIEFSEETARSAMVPLGELVTLPLDCTPEDVERQVASTGFSRFPITRAGGPDGAELIITGYIHLKDILGADERERREPVPAWRSRALVPVRADDEVEDVLAAMQRTGAHLGRVLEPVGQGRGERTIGVVFLEDILEELVGEVNDAMQREEHQRRDRD
ncbi:hemolysin family protein [Actinomyces marmotae]|uniref:hemolysin family protein n=1 Tax=Actinomyces marmotae TaxID=2737173 RepID=UPI00135937EF|nr:hemolysin family protein [Actinomyces marmotae]